jgi:hypothetical protein
VLERLFKPLLAPLRAPPRAPRRHCRRRTELELSTRARRRLAAPVASLGPNTPPQLAYCPAQRPPSRVPRATTATTVGRRRTPSPAVPPPQRRLPTAPR